MLQLSIRNQVYFFLKNISSVCMANCTLVKFQEPTPFILILKCNCVQSDQHKMAPCSLAKQSAFRFLKKTLYLVYLSSFSYHANV